MLAQENRLMMMDPSGMNALVREFWEMKRTEIMQQRRRELGVSTASGGGMTDNGDGTSVDGGGGWFRRWSYSVNV